MPYLFMVSDMMPNQQPAGRPRVGASKSGTTKEVVFGEQMTVSVKVEFGLPGPEPPGGQNCQRPTRGGFMLTYRSEPCDVSELSD
jgi:hypothetical protein